MAFSRNDFLKQATELVDRYGQLEVLVKDMLLALDKTQQAGNWQNSDLLASWKDLFARAIGGGRAEARHGRECQLGSTVAIL